MPEFEVIAGDMFDEIGCVEPASCRCVLIDPPYMIGTQSVHRDNMHGAGCAACSTQAAPSTT